MPKLPESIGKYKITGRLGKGGMSILYLAEHPSLGTTVVLKKLTMKGDPAHRERFRREATLMMKLRHENVVGVYDHFKEGGSHYLVMEFIDGRPLSELMAGEGALTGPEARWLAWRIAVALAHIHSQGIVHRDLKPSNVLLGRDGSVKLGDFGIAFTPGGDDDITSGGTALGTPSFMAPEQLEDARGADVRSDMWSFGVCLFEMLTGRKFVSGTGPAGIREALPDAVRNMPRRLPPELPGRLRRLLKKALRMKPESRLKDAEAALRLLGSAPGKNHSPPEILQRRLKNLFASMDPDPEPTPAAESPGDGNSGIPELKSLFRPGGNGGRPPVPSEGSPLRRNLLSGLPGEHPSVFIAAIGFLILFLAMAVFPGAFSTVFRRNTAGGLRLSLVFPGEVADSWLTGAEATIFRETDNSLSEVRTPVLKPSDNGDSLDSRRIVLPVGAYRLRWSLGDRVSWYSFYLSSFHENRKNGRGNLLLEETLGEPPVFSLELSWSAEKALSGEDITRETRMSWKRLDEPGDELLSGAVYRFHFDVPGYQPEIFDVAVSPWRRNLNLHASLWPQPAVLIIRNNSSRMIMPRLDGSGRFLDMEDSPRMKRIGSLGKGHSGTLFLLPGSYRISPGMGGSAMKSFSVQPGGKVYALVETDEENHLFLRISGSDSSGE